VVARTKNPSPRSETPKVYSFVGLRTEFGALAAKVMRQFELGGITVISETFILVTKVPVEVGSAEYKIERISRASGTGITIVPPAPGLPPVRTSFGKSVTWDPGMPPTFTAVGTG